MFSTCKRNAVRKEVLTFLKIRETPTRTGQAHYHTSFTTVFDFCSNMRIIINRDVYTQLDRSSTKSKPSTIAYSGTSFACDLSCALLYLQISMLLTLSKFIFLPRVRWHTCSIILIRVRIALNWQNICYSYDLRFMDFVSPFRNEF